MYTEVDRSWGDTGYRDTDAGYRDTDPGYSFEEPQDTVHSGTKITLRNNIVCTLHILKKGVNFAVKKYLKILTLEVK